jgi:peptidoglycan biosynthesis protein MviN/MurJ (putative lipid II flippase)
MVERIVASFLFPGAITLVNMGKVFVTMMGALHGPFSNAYYKKLVSSADGETDSLPTRLRETLNISVLVGFPIVIVAFLFHEEILLLLFSGKGFGEKGPLLGSIALAIIAGFPHIFILGTFVRIFQSQSRLKQILYYYGVAIAAYLVLAPLSAKLFGAVGLAAAYSTTLNTLTIVMFVKLKQLGRAPVFDREFGRICLAGAAAFLSTWLAVAWIGTNTLMAFVIGSILSVLSLIAFGRALNVAHVRALLAFRRVPSAEPKRNLDRSK